MVRAFTAIFFLPSPAFPASRAFLDLMSIHSCCNLRLFLVRTFFLFTRFRFLATDEAEATAAGAVAVPAAEDGSLVDILWDADVSVAGSVAVPAADDGSLVDILWDVDVSALGEERVPVGVYIFL